MTRDLGTTPIMNKHILVTGARGLLGAEVIARLTAKGYSVVAFLRSDGPVVRNDGTPIAGLFAAGADVGGISTGGYASGLAAALVLGHVAAESVTA